MLSQPSVSQRPREVFSRYTAYFKQPLSSTDPLIESSASLSRSHAAHVSSSCYSRSAAADAFGGRGKRRVVGGGIPSVRFSRIALHTRPKQTITTPATTTRDRPRPRTSHNTSHNSIHTLSGATFTTAIRHAWRKRKVDRRQGGTQGGRREESEEPQRKGWPSGEFFALLMRTRPTLAGCEDCERSRACTRQPAALWTCPRLHVCCRKSILDRMRRVAANSAVPFNA